VSAIRPGLPGGAGCSGGADSADLAIGAVLPVGTVLAVFPILPGGALFAAQFVQGDQHHPGGAIIVLYVAALAAHLWRGALGTAGLAGRKRQDQGHRQGCGLNPLHFSSSGICLAASWIRARYCFSVMILTFFPAATSSCAFPCFRS